MPLDARKLAKIATLNAAALAQRTQNVTLTLMQTGGTTTTITVPCIFRLSEDADPIFSDAKQADAICQFQQSDVTLPQLRSTVKLTLASGAPGPTIGNSYTITQIAIKGLMPGGDRYICTLNRIN